MAKVIYDFGMNDGSDTAYYLKKGFKVVAVEANSRLSAQARERFAREISDGRLVLLNVALSQQDTAELVVFYVHKYHELSQLPRPSPDRIADFTEQPIAQRTASSIVAEHGEPHYIKIDVEHFDHIALADLLDHGIRPDFISAEAHDIRIFCLLVAAGYDSFNLVDGLTVPNRYGRAQIKTPSGSSDFSFRLNSAGPFGEDIDGPWLDRGSFFEHLRDVGLGWKDIHASNVISPTDGPVTTVRQEALPRLPVSLREHLIDLIPSIGRAAKSRFFRA